MDPLTVKKLGDVTIQRVPLKPDESKPKVVRESENETIPNSIASQFLHIPKLPPSINITVKSNPTVPPGSSNSEVKSVKEVRQVPASSSFKTISLGPGVELRKREDVKSNDTKASNSSCYDTNLEKEKSKEIKETGRDDADVDFCDEEDKRPLDSFPSDSECDDENDEFDDDSVEEKMELENASNLLLKSNLNEDELNKDEKEDKFDDEDLEDENLEDEYKDESVPTDIPEDIPAIPIEELAEDTPEDMVCKEEQYSDQEHESNESDDADDESDKEADGGKKTVSRKKKKRKPKSEDNSDDDINEMKKQKTSPEKDQTSDGESAEKSEGTDKLSEVKKGQLRRNIREVMDETKLEEATLAAQRQEMERLRRVQEQQRIIRDVQRQIAQNRQNSKMQARVLSLLQKGTTSLIKKEEEEEERIEEKKPNTVVVKLSTGSGPPQIVNRKVLDMLKKQNLAEDEEEEAAKDKLVNLSINLDKPQMMTPTVSIAPVKPESKPIEVVNEKEEEKPKDKDVVMISSSSGEEDDCIVISEEEESEPDEDPTNSGMHTNDLYNVPDEQGRVLINVGHPESEKDVFLAPQIARIIKPHQIGGVRFLFDNIVESLNRYKTSEGFGCILAHSMGLGKTLQVVSFCDVFLRYTEGKTVLCIMPINTLQNWMAEFNMWLPTDPENSPLREQGEVSTRQFPIFVLNDNQKTLAARANVIQNWYKEGGVLLIGYELYRQLSLKKPPKSRNRGRRKTEAEEDLEDEKSKNLLDIMYNALVKPGPDLVICDEGHRIKNSHASISQALKQIRSKRRVVLTGYPLQNNLLEYWCMVDFVRPNYLGTKTEFSNMFERPIQNGQCIDSTPQDIRLMRHRAHVLHSLLEGFVQRRSHSVLQQTLPSKYEYVLLLRLTPFQRGLYNTFMNEVVRTKAVPNPLKAFAVCCKIWNHPDILYNFLKKRAADEDLDLDIEETAAGIGTPASGPSTPMTPSTPPHQVNKRSRSGRGGKGGKEAKLPRKNARNSNSQTNNKTPLIAAVPPNTASTTKPSSPEKPVTNTNTQPVQSFNSFSNQFQGFNQQNENYEFNQQNNANQNFNNQFRQEYNSQNVSNNQDYSSANYQQNFSDSNFYPGEFNQNNYWQGNNDGGNFYNNTSSQSTDEYFQQNVPQNNTQYNSSEYGANSDSGQGNFNNSNYNFDLNSQMNYSGNFPIKQENNVTHFAMNDNVVGGGDMLLDSTAGDMNNQMFSDNFRADCDSGNLSHFANQNVSIGKPVLDNISMMNNMNEQAMLNINNGGNKRQALPSFNSAQVRTSQNQMNNARLPMSNDTAINFNAFPPQQQTKPVRAPGRPRNVGVRSGAVGRPRKNAKNPAGQMKDQEFMKFKPGLPGGAPILKQGIADGQNFQNVPVPQTIDAAQASHLLGNQLTADDLNVLSQNQIGANFLDSLRSEELWNPNATEQNALFNEQNFIYDDPDQILNTQSANFIGNEAPSLLGGVRATRNMLNDIQTGDNLFGAVQTNYPQQNPAADASLFVMENFNYLNELQNANYQLSSHTSFMNLLEGNENLSINQNPTPAEDIMKGNQFNVQQAVNAQLTEGFMDSTIPFQNSDLPDRSNTMNTINAADMSIDKNVSFEIIGTNESQIEIEKDLDRSIVGLARRGQITLKKVDKKNESANKLNNQNAISELTRTMGIAANAVQNQSQTSFQNAQNRLPSIDIFNTSQNFVSTARLNQETAAFSPMNQFVYNDSQTSASTPRNSNQGQTNWDNFNVSATTNDFSGPINEKPQFAFNQNQVIQSSANKPLESPQFNDRRNVVSNIKQELQEDGNFGSDSRTMFKKDTYPGPYPTPTSTANQNQENVGADDSRNRFVSAQNEQKKVEEKSNVNLFQAPAPGKTETPQSPANKAKMNPPSSISAKIAEKKQQLRRNLPLSTRMEMAKQMQQKNEPFNPRQTQNDLSQFTPSVTIKPSGSSNANLPKNETKDGKGMTDDVESDVKMPAPELPAPKSVKEEPGIPYDWTNEFFKDYEPGKIEASAKTMIFFCMLEEIIRLGDRLLLFSQSLFTLDLIEDFLQMYNIPGYEEKWARNKSYFRLDGSTSALEREKLINEFNNNPSVHLFLVSTRAGSLGINLVGANRVVVFDASWNPCHDTQAVCRVYRYGQQKSCYVYRFVMDNCLEKKIYDRQINKQGMSDRVVDECNPDAHLTIKDVSNLCWDSNEDLSDANKDFSGLKDKYNDVVIQKVIEKFSSSLSKEPFQHESLLIDRKDNKLSQAEKRMAKRSYELEKQANLKPSYGFYNNPHPMQNRMNKPMASVRPMQVDNTQAQREGPRRWIPAEVWQKQGMSAQEMTLPLDVVIPTNASDSRSSIVLKAGQKVMVLKSPKGIYMQLENGKIIAIKTAMKNALSQGSKPMPAGMPRNMGMNQGGMNQGGVKMLPRPAVERPLASLSNRRDVTVSPIRNRFVGNMRTNQNPNPNIPMGGGGMRPGFARGPRPGQPIVRTFPLPRPQNSPQPQNRLKPAIPGAPKQIFGPNSSVTISTIGNKKKMEGQEPGNMTEVNYEDYNSLSRLKDMQNLPLGRRFEDEDEPPEYPNMNEGMTSRLLDSVNFSSRMSDAASRSASTSQSSDSSTRSGTQSAPKFSDNPATKSNKFSDIIPEALRHKKDINLTPVIPPSAKNEERSSNVPKNSAPKMTPSTSFQAQQQQFQQKPTQLGTKPTPNSAQFPPSGTIAGGGKNRKETITATKSEPRVKTGKNDTPSLNIPETMLAKKDVQVSVKNPELPVKSSSQHSISIFPIAKKQEDDSQGSSAESSHSQSYEGESNTSYQTKNPPYYGDYQKPYGDYYQDRKSSSESPQYSNQYYQSNFPQQEYQPQRQHSYGSSQYSSAPYSTHDYNRSSYSGDNSQYVNSMFSNQSHPPTSTGSFNSYDQYAWPNFQQSKAESSQNSPVQPPPPSQPPPQ